MTITDTVRSTTFLALALGATLLLSLEIIRLARPGAPRTTTPPPWSVPFAHPLPGTR
jgi:hypothetical protein